MKIEITALEYRKLLELSERFAGSVEPGYRFLRLYYWKGLRAFITDGCGKLEIPLRKDCAPFTGSYIIPLDHARALKEQLRDDAKLVITGKEGTVSIFLGGEKLQIDKARTENIPRMERKFENIFSMKKNTLKNALDFSSSINDEGDNISFVFNNELACIITSSHNMTVLNYLDIPISRNLQAHIPYVTVRHLVKTLDLIKAEESNFGEGIEDLGIKVGPLLFSICCDREKLFNTVPRFPEIKEKIVIEKNQFLFSVRKLTKLVSRGIKVLILSDHGNIRFMLKAGNFRYEKIMVNAPFKNFAVGVDPHRLRSALSRMNSGKVELFIFNNQLILAGKNSGQHLILPLI